MKPPSLKRLASIAANICSEYKCLPCDLGKLTNLQVYAILFHKRDKETNAIPIEGDESAGSLFDFSERTPSLPELLAMVEEMGRLQQWSGDRIDEMKEKMRERFARKEAESGQPGS